MSFCWILFQLRYNYAIQTQFLYRHQKDPPHFTRRYRATTLQQTKKPIVRWSFFLFNQCLCCNSFNDALVSSIAWLMPSISWWAFKSFSLCRSIVAKVWAAVAWASLFVAIVASTELWAVCWYDRNFDECRLMKLVSVGGDLPDP